MVQITGTVYDNGLAGGDGNATQETKYVDATGTNDRVTTILYDFRDRRTDTDGEINFYARQYFDNLDRVYQNDRYDTTIAGNLIGRSLTHHDDRCRVYQAVTIAVDPRTGIVGNSLTSNRWFDATGNVIKSLPAGSQMATKLVFDSLGRQTMVYAAYNYSDTTYSTAVSVVGDTILEQSEMTYDTANNIIQTDFRLRYHNATGTGPLGSPSSAQPLARATYVATYADAIGRTVVTANYGTNGGTALSRPTTSPARSSTCLVTSIQFDGAGNRQVVTDSANAVTSFAFDATGRETSRIMNYLTGSSSSSSSSTSGCSPSLDSNVTILTAYTADGQVASITAINPLTNNQITQYAYGTTLANSAIASSLLLASEIVPDSVGGSDQLTWTYNRQGQKTTLTDPNGTVHTYTFDLLGRPIDDGVTTVGTGVDTAVLRIATTYEVRSLVQNRTSYDNATVGSGNIVNDVQFAYNTFSQLVNDYQSHAGAVNVSSTPNVQYGYAVGSSNSIRPTSATYPNGRVLNYNYGTSGETNDAASRIGSLIDSDGVTHLTDYSYLGGSALTASSGQNWDGGLPTLASPFNPASIVSVNSTQPGIQYTLIGIQGGNDPVTGDIYRGIDQFGRVKDLIWVPSGGPSSSSSSSSSSAGTNLVRIQHTYDLMGNRLSRRDVVAESAGAGLDELYQYDFINRLKELDRGTLNSGANVITGKKFAQCWTLDTTGNWSGFREDDNGDGIWDLVQNRSSNPVNEITGITNAVGSAWVQPKFNAAGNMTTVPQPATPTLAYACTYDAWNRLVKVVDVPSSNTVVQYAYDGATRRAIKNTYTAGVLFETRHYYYTDPHRWQVVEERLDTSTNAERQFVWGLRYIDDLVLRDRDTTGSGPLNERFYGMQDPNWNMNAMVNSAGVVEERYSYNAYGTVTFLTGFFAFRTASLFAWETLYAGYRLDSETLLYAVRNRTFDPLLGWLQRDPLGVSAGLNLFEYVHSNPFIGLDPSGLACDACSRYCYCRLGDCEDEAGARYVKAQKACWITTILRIAACGLVAAALGWWFPPAGIAGFLACLAVSAAFSAACFYSANSGVENDLKNCVTKQKHCLQVECPDLNVSPDFKCWRDPVPSPEDDEF
jgi:RHS repeat-associated protein